MKIFGIVYSIGAVITGISISYVLRRIKMSVAKVLAIQLSIILWPIIWVPWGFIWAVWKK